MSKIIIANWKMNLNQETALELWGNIKDEWLAEAGVQLIVCPVFTAISEFKELLKGLPRVSLGAQDCFWENKGAYTGEVSPQDLSERGCHYVILGHSERRRYFKETDEMINKKISAAITAGLTPIFCVGETKEERSAGKTEEIIKAQLQEGLKGIEIKGEEGVLIAYEPVWAISTFSTGENCDASEAIKIHKLIKEEIGRLFPGADVPILYGGSVDENNVMDYIKEDVIDGVLVGGASTKFSSLLQIINKVRELS